MAGMNGSQAHKVSPEEANRLDGPGKREESNTWTVCRKVRMSHSKPKVMQAEKVIG